MYTVNAVVVEFFKFMEPPGSFLALGTLFAPYLTYERRILFMKRKIVMLFLILVTFVLLAAANVFAQGRHGNQGNHGSMRQHSGWDNDNGRHRYRGRNRFTYGYKNYGQYRRTQVGNRRFRMARRYYWRDGVRLSRLVRVYY
jgi:hypothetical protein